MRCVHSAQFLEGNLDVIGRGIRIDVVRGVTLEAKLERVTVVDRSALCGRLHNLYLLSVCTRRNVCHALAGLRDLHAGIISLEKSVVHLHEPHIATYALESHLPHVATVIALASNRHGGHSDVANGH